MKRVIKKSWRGLTGLFVLKIGVICLLLTIQACSDAIEPKINFDQTAIDEYESFINRGVFNSSFGNSANLEVEEMSESQAKEVLSDFTDQSMKFLIGIGFDKSTIDSELGGVNSPNTAAIAYIILEEIKKDKSSASYFDLNSLMMNQSYAQGDVLDCALEAFGFAAVGYIFQYGIEEAIEHYGKKGLIKVLGKAAGKTLGWVGLAIAAYEFTDCMTK